ncbi:MAG TPA: hypothetical protein VFN57_12910 [Thermomicrobiaceae bacterium]|nr:hypothetical protein [Thermomicrobiaceae bacterium]
MWDVMLDYEVRRRELARQRQYAWLAREANRCARIRRGASLRGRLSALLLALGTRLAPRPSRKPAVGWAPLLEDLCR